MVPDSASIPDRRALQRIPDGLLAFKVRGDRLLGQGTKAFEVIIAYRRVRCNIGKAGVNIERGARDLVEEHS